MSVFVAGCPGCGHKIGVPRPGSDPATEKAKVQCPFCGRDIDRSLGYEVSEPPEKQEPFDLLSVE